MTTSQLLDLKRIWRDTARLGGLSLSDGAGLTTLSGHDFLGLAAPVPEPEVWASLLAGAFALIGARRRRSLALRAAG